VRQRLYSLSRDIIKEVYFVRVSALLTVWWRFVRSHQYVRWGGGRYLLLPRQSSLWRFLSTTSVGTNLDADGCVKNIM